MNVNQKEIANSQSLGRGKDKIFSPEKDIKRICIITFAAFLMALNINCLVHAGGLYPGGATGLTLLIQRIFSDIWDVAVPYTFINLLLNAIPVYIGYKFIGKKLTVYSVYMIVMTSLLTDIIPEYHLTDDVMLATLFGGIVNGSVISMCLASNANTGGTDFIALYFSQKKGIEGFNVSLAINGVILACAGYLFGIDKAMYSIVFQYISTQVVHLLFKKYQKATMLIVTNYPQDVCTTITKISNHGATILHGEGAYEGDEHTVVYSVVSKSDVEMISKAITRTDPKAFVNVINTTHLNGKFYNRPME